MIWKRNANLIKHITRRKLLFTKIVGKLSKTTKVNIGEVIDLSQSLKNTMPHIKQIASNFEPQKFKSSVKISPSSGINRYVSKI